MYAVFYTAMNVCTLAHEDRYRVFEAYHEAVEFYNNILEMDGLYCAGIGEIKVGTEAHWTGCEITPLPKESKV